MNEQAGWSDPQGQPAGQAQPPYGQYPYGQPIYVYPPSRPTNTMAIIALVLSLTVAPAGLICGLIARKQIRETGEEGEGLALAGTIIGGVITAFYVLYILFVVVVVIASFASA